MGLGGILHDGAPVVRSEGPNHPFCPGCYASNIAENGNPSKHAVMPWELLHSDAVRLATPDLWSWSPFGCALQPLLPLIRGPITLQAAFGFVGNHHCQPAFGHQRLEVVVLVRFAVLHAHQRLDFASLAGLFAKSKSLGCDLSGRLRFPFSSLLDKRRMEVQAYEKVGSGLQFRSGWTSGVTGFTLPGRIYPT